MKYYKVIDLQGASFMDYTWHEPMTAQQIRSLRWDDYKDGLCDPDYFMKFKHFTLDFIQDFWEIRLVDSQN